MSGTPGERIERWNNAARKVAKEYEAAEAQHGHAAELLLIPKMPKHGRHPEGGMAITRPLLHADEDTLTVFAESVKAGLFSPN